VTGLLRVRPLQPSSGRNSIGSSFQASPRPAGKERSQVGRVGSIRPQTQLIARSPSERPADFVDPARREPLKIFSHGGISQIKDADSACLRIPYLEDPGIRQHTLARIGKVKAYHIVTSRKCGEVAAKSGITEVGKH
jgi:hypothetical protein